MAWGAHFVGVVEAAGVVGQAVDAELFSEVLGRDGEEPEVPLGGGEADLVVLLQQHGVRHPDRFVASGALLRGSATYLVRYLVVLNERERLAPDAYRPPLKKSTSEIKV